MITKVYLIAYDGIITMEIVLNDDSSSSLAGVITTKEFRIKFSTYHVIIL